MLGEFSGNDRFAIIRRLGAGGMGTVYEAQDRERNARVALKTLRNIDADGIYRFKVEFRSLAELSHRNLLPLYELFCEGDQWFFTMELLEGATDLRSFIRGGGNGRKSPGSSNSTQHRTQVTQVQRTAEASSGPTVEISPSQIPAPTGTATSLETLENAPLHAPNSDSGPPTLLASAPTWFGEKTMPAAATTVLLDSSLPVAAAAEPAHVSLVAGSSAENLDYDRIRRAFLTVAHGVHALHLAGKLHRDLKPENVMVRADGQPVLLDFGLILNLKPQAAVSAAGQPGQPAYEATSDKQISGTLAYMAPEQARGAPLSDSSDWYAFGVMLFEALTGRLPFAGSGAEIMRARLTQDSPPPSSFVPATPPDLDALCRRLLDRDPQRRPRSAEIFACLSGQSAVVDDGAIGPNVFIGREEYLASLQAAYAGLEQGHPAILCVHGRSGVGKTTLLQHFLSQAVNSRGAVLLEGRCYEQESVPYKALDNLVDALTQLLLEMPDEQLADILPEHVQSLARVFPVLKRVEAIGSGDAAATANDPVLVRRQAFQALGRLMAAVGARHKLVLFIDDLQWGDVDSAQLLADVLAQQPSPRMLVLLSYRSEYAGDPCLREFRRAWESGHIPSQELEVLPLTPEESRELAGKLLAGSAVTDAQIERIVDQARGSAFFVQELAESLRSGMEWQVDARGQDRAAVQAADLDEVLWKRIQQLPADARLLIEMISVAGQPIRFGDLLHTRSLESFPQHSVKLLRTARLVRSTGIHLSDEIETFHDRVRESVTKFLAAPVSRDYHGQIADALEQNPEAAPETIAGHLEAAQSSRASHFYELAGERAVQVLAFDRAEEFLKRAAALAPSQSDRVRVEVRLVHFYTDMARFQDAYNVACDGAARLDFKLPRKFSPPLLLFNMARGLMRKGRRKPSEFLDLPEMTDERLIAVVKLISAVGKAAYQVRPEICVTICTMAVNLCLKHGNTPDAAIDYMVFGCIFLGGIVGRAQTGYDFGRLALDLIEKYQNEQQRAEVNFVVGYFGTSWLRPAVEAEKLWEIAFREGQRTGDLFHTGCAVTGTTLSLIMRGVPLDEVERRIDAYWPVVERAHLREPKTSLTSARRLIACLRTPPNRAADFPPAEDEPLLADLAAFGARHFAHFHFLNQCMLHALTGNVAAGLDAAARSAAYLPDSKGLLNTPEHFFWSAMLHAIGETKGAAKDLASARKKFAAWTSRCAANFGVRHALLAAEEARLHAKPDDALRIYREAAALAGEYKNLHLEGFANRRAAALASSLGQSGEAQQFEHAAARAFCQWGALALVPRQSIPPDPQPALSYAQGDRR